MRLLLLLVSCLPLGCATRSPAKVPAELTYAPSAVPDRIILTWAEDPITAQSVTWRTDTSVARPIAEIAVATPGSEFKAVAQRVTARSTELSTDLGVALYHTANFRELRASTKYVYRVGDGVNWSEWSHFTTASDKPEPFSFIYFGDAQNDIKSHWSRVVREAFKDAPRASFLLHAGDLVNGANRDSEWGEWFYSAGWILRTMPSIATPGNHEYQGAQLSRHWQPMFEFPKNGPDGLEETVYYIDYQGARIVSLNTNRNLDAQVKWFDEMMQNNDARWTIVTMHHPVFSTAGTRDNRVLRNKLQPLFDRHQIDIVLQGHDHTYSRTDRMRHIGDDHKHPHEGAPPEQNVPIGLRAQSDQSGTVYVVSVSGPKMYNLSRKPFMIKATAQKQLYQVITVGETELRYSAYAANGELFDRFVLKKTEGRPNELIEVMR